MKISKSLIFFSSRGRHTRYIGDWSSDVCSSDLYRRSRCPPFGPGAATGSAITKKKSWNSRPSRRSEERRVGKEAALRRKLRGDVRFDNGSRALYATDASNYRQLPIAVVIPREAA